jgi:hypothetical protein
VSRVTVGMMRFPAVLTAVALVALLPAGGAQAATPKAKRCTAKGAKTVVKSSSARVFTADGAGPHSDDTDIQQRLYGCLYSTGRRVLLATSWDDDYVTSGSFSSVRLNGRFVAWQFDAYDISCKAGCPPDYNPLHQSINLADLRTPREDSFVGAAKPDTLAVTKGGTATWLDATTGEPRSAALR